MYRRVTPYARKRTHFTSRKRAGRIPGEVVGQSYIRKRVYDVDPSWFTLEGYITVCVAYERHQPGIWICHTKEEPPIWSSLFPPLCVLCRDEEPWRRYWHGQSAGWGTEVTGRAQWTGTATGKITKINSMQNLNHGGHFNTSCHITTAQTSTLTLFLGVLHADPQVS